MLAPANVLLFQSVEMRIVAIHSWVNWRCDSRPNGSGGNATSGLMWEFAMSGITTNLIRLRLSSVQNIIDFVFLEREAGKSSIEMQRCC